MDLQGGGGEQNLDSLLDTMANAVGIFVVVLALAQLTVGQAVRRIQEREAEQSEAAAERSDTKPGEQLAALQESWAEARSRQWETGREIERLTSRLAASALPTAQADASPRSAGERNARLARDLLEAESLEKRVADKRSQLAALQVQLRTDTSELASAASQVRLPDPRLAPPGTSETLFVCRYGRVALVPQRKLFAALANAKQRAGAVSGLTRGAAAGTRSRLAEYLDQNQVGDDDFRWSLLEQGIVGRASRITWRREEVGETWSQMRRPHSEFRRALRTAPPSKRYLHFFVWNDSFQVYVEARRLAEEAGFAVGWKPLEADDALSESYRSPSSNLRPLPVD